MPPLSVPIILDASARLMIEEGLFSLTLRRNTVSMKLPTTRRLAEFLQVPHYYVLPLFAVMEEEALVTRAERVGIMTTPEGTSRMARIFHDSYPDEAREILGETLFNYLLSQENVSSPGNP